MVCIGLELVVFRAACRRTSELFTFVRNQTLTIKAADGTILQQQGPATREQLKLEMPKPLIQAFIASETERFYQHRR